MNKELKIGKMIEYYLDEFSYTRKKLGEKLGKSESAVSKWVTGASVPSANDLSKMTFLFKTDIQTLMYGGEDNSKKDSNENNLYPFYDTGVAAGALADVGSFLESNSETILVSNSVMGKYASKSDVFITYVNGDSMNNVIPDKSMIAVKRISDAFCLEDGDIVVFRNGAGMSVKRFYNDKSESRLVFRPDSSEKSFVDTVVGYDEADDLQIYGKVVVYVVNL